MKSGIHPQLFETKVHCNGCGTDFVTRSTVDAITVEICSNCHPFYTGKQKLIDTAGRVEKFQARRQAAEAAKVADQKRADSKAKAGAAKALKNDPEMATIAEELESKTVDQDNQINQADKTPQSNQTEPVAETTEDDSQS